MNWKGVRFYTLKACFLQCTSSSKTALCHNLSIQHSPVGTMFSDVWAYGEISLSIYCNGVPVMSIMLRANSTSPNIQITTRLVYLASTNTNTRVKSWFPFVNLSNSELKKTWNWRILLIQRHFFCRIFQYKINTKYLEILEVNTVD